MIKGLLSVIIPSRSPQYLHKTVNDLLVKAKEEIEIIVILDGIWLEKYWDDPRVKIIHHGTVHDNKGMRGSINKGMAVAQGEYVMKTDEHCMFDEGFDRKLKADCKDNWVVIPRRYRLDAEKWEIIKDGRPPIDYMYMEYPFLKPFDQTQGLHGALWNERYYSRKNILIDDTPTMQGSCYFMKKSYWDELFPNGLDEKNYGPFTQEAQEITMTAWFSGGRVVVNKKTWYAHLHKGHGGKGYGFSNQQYKKHSEWNERGRVFCISKWLYTKEYKYDFEWFIDSKFPNMPKWPKNWRERIEIDKKKDYSTLKYKDSYWLSNLKGQDLSELILKPTKNKIVGNGDIATVLKEADEKGLLFFASGVSNSQEKRESEYQREKDLLLSQDKSKHIVYFSSLAVFYGDSRYVEHKKEMEKLVKDNFSRYCIVRIGNIAWGSNSYTILNFFKNKIKNNEPFEIQDTYRYIVGKDEFLYWINMIPDWNVEMNIVGRRMKVSEIVEEIKKGKL